MSIFNLPDLGEGLLDAEIHEWFVCEGSQVVIDQPLVAMETAKAVVELPSPQSGIIKKFFGKPGDLIKTGGPLVEFASTTSIDKGSVVGSLEESNEQQEGTFIIGASSPSTKATPLVRNLAKKLGVNLNSVHGSGEYGLITKQDVEAMADSITNSSEAQVLQGFEPLRGVRRAMLATMVLSHKEVVLVSIFDEVDVEAWIKDGDLTVRVIRALSKACVEEPALNAWFDTNRSARKCFAEVNLGLAIDSTQGLFVPVIEKVDNYSDEGLRLIINEYKQAVEQRTISNHQLQGASIVLSNFGKFAGRFATPIIVAPMVSILAVGRLYKQVVLGPKNNFETHHFLPLSLSFDHRAVTGGEASRFLAVTIQALQTR